MRKDALTSFRNFSIVQKIDDAKRTIHGLMIYMILG
jgi:translation elongation factor EF-4